MVNLLKGYVGTAACAGCHEEKYLSWRETLHAKMIQDPHVDRLVIEGNFWRNDPNLPFTLDDVAYTVGSRWKQEYLTQTEAGDFFILPAQWHIETQEWVPSNSDTWQNPENEWRRACGSCHVTGLNTQTWGFVEFGLGCESCHGPGAAHVANPQTFKPYQAVDDQVCGACHSRGVSPEGHPFPASYRPGDNLSNHFTFSTAESDVWPDGSAKRNYQQYQDWTLGNTMAASGDVKCATCHAVHGSDNEPAHLAEEMNELCLQCHNDRRAIVQHTPFHNEAVKERDFYCSDCHMPQIATSAVAYDIHSHAFQQPNPQASIDHGGVEAMPNACNTCHTQSSPEWAAETIAYVLENQELVQQTFFGPGPTPTSPPPPTPIPSAGQKADVSSIQVESSQWMRTIFFVLLGLAILGAIYFIYRVIKARR
jgi:predicted CXXCH cytochrome family protein